MNEANEDIRIRDEGNAQWSNRHADIVNRRWKALKEMRQAKRRVFDYLETVRSATQSGYQVCMFTYMYVCISVCMWECDTAWLSGMYVHLYVCMYICMYAGVRHIARITYVYVHLCVSHTHTNRYACVCACVCACVRGVCVRARVRMGGWASGCMTPK
jgi:hypothetical protein